MTRKKKDGGPAFPTDEWFDEELIGQIPGMSLRDYIAIHAPGEELGELRYDHHGVKIRSWQEARYMYADSMLRAREGK